MHTEVKYTHKLQFTAIYSEMHEKNKLMDEYSDA